MQIFFSGKQGEVVIWRERYVLDAAAGSSRPCQSSSLLSKALTSALKHVEHEGAGLGSVRPGGSCESHEYTKERGRD